MNDIPATQSRVEIYTKSWCPYCHRALALLDSLGVTYEKYDVSSDRERRDEMLARASGRTVPQIFIDDREIGGNDALQTLHREGALQALLFPPTPGQSARLSKANQ